MSTQATDPDDFLNEGAGPPAFKFSEVGTTVKGDVVAARVGIARKFGTKEPDYWEDGTPKRQLLVDLRTDDGDVRLYCKPALKAAIAEAVTEAGGKLSEGGTLTVKRTEDTPAEKAGLNPKQNFKAKFETPTVSADDLEDW